MPQGCLEALEVRGGGVGLVGHAGCLVRGSADSRDGTLLDQQQYDHQLHVAIPNCAHGVRFTRPVMHKECCKIMSVKVCD